MCSVKRVVSSGKTASSRRGSAAGAPACAKVQYEELASVLPAASRDSMRGRLAPLSALAACKTLGTGNARIDRDWGVFVARHTGRPWWRRMCVHTRCSLRGGGLDRSRRRRGPHEEFGLLLGARGSVAGQRRGSEVDSGGGHDSGCPTMNDESSSSSATARPGDESMDGAWRRPGRRLGRSQRVMRNSSSRIRLPGFQEQRGELVKKAV